MTGNENDRCVWNGAAEFLLKLKTIHSRQVNVRDHTVEILRIGGLEEFLRAGVCDDLEAGGGELEDKGIAHALLILDYRDPDASSRRNSIDVVDVFPRDTLRSDRSLCRSHHPSSQCVSLQNVPNTTFRPADRAIVP